MKKMTRCIKYPVSVFLLLFLGCASCDWSSNSFENSATYEAWKPIHSYEWEPIASDPARSATLHIAQTARGSNTGLTAANAHSVAWFNNAENWGTGDDQIGPGDVVAFHGTITTALVIQGDGAAGTGSTIQIDFSYDGVAQPLMKSSSEVQIDNNGHKYITYQNITFSNAATEGDLISLSVKSAYIRITGCSYNGLASSTVYAIRHSSGENTLIENNEFKNVCGGVVGHYISNHNITIRNNSFIGSTTNANCDQDIIKFGDAYNVLLDGNYLVVRKQPWGANSDDNHCDVVQLYKKGGSGSGEPQNWEIRNNYIELDSVNPNHRSWFMFEDINGKFLIYNNIFVGTSGGESGNGLHLSILQSPFVNIHLYNNTFVSKSGPNQLITMTKCTSTDPRVITSRRMFFKNNIIYVPAASTRTIFDPDRFPDNLEHTNNVYYGGGRYNGLTAAEWTALETNARNVDPAFVDDDADDYHLADSSPVVAAGVNLSKIFTTDKDGVQRPSSLAWSNGAFQK